MKALTPEQIRQMFQDLELGEEEQRESFRRMGSAAQEANEPSTQLFIRIVSSTASEEEHNNA